MISSFFFFKQKTAYEMRISDWSSDVCSSDLPARGRQQLLRPPRRAVEVQPELGRERRRQVLRRRHAVVRRAAPDLVTGRSPTGANVVVATFSLSPTSQSTRPETAGFFVRSEEHTSVLQSLMRISYAVFFLTKKKEQKIPT